MTDPTVVFVVLSASTASNDIGIKNQEYRDTPSIQRYMILLSQDDQHATVFARSGGDRVGHIMAGDVTLEIPIPAPLAELYSVSFNGAGDAEAGLTG